MIARHILKPVHAMGLIAGISIIQSPNVSGQSIHPPTGTPLPEVIAQPNRNVSILGHGAGRSASMLRYRSHLASVSRELRTSRMAAALHL